jgi:hypothetical protein
LRFATPPTITVTPHLRIARACASENQATYGVRSRSCIADVKASEATDAEDRAEPAEGGVTVGGGGDDPLLVSAAPPKPQAVPPQVPLDSACCRRLS